MCWVCLAVGAIKENAWTGTPSTINSALTFSTYSAESASERMRITSAGNVGIGVTNPSSYYTAGNDLVVGGTGSHGISIKTGATNQGILAFAKGTSGGSEQYAGYILYNHGTGSAEHMQFAVGAIERLRIDNSGNVVLKPTNPAGISGTNSNYLGFRITQTNGQSALLGTIKAQGQSSWGGDLVFSTKPNNGSPNDSVTERLRIGSNGYVYYGNQTGANPAASGTAGLTIRPDPLFSIAANSNSCMNVGRNTNDGVLVNFYQAGTAEGNISVSGTTVSYNGAHLARWSQLANGAERIEILRGSVLSNIDEMCEWGEEENEQLNRMKVSDVEGDRNVSGVFQAWDDDDDIYVNDFYCAMTGDFVIRIAQGTTVARGDLLMSAGDGTAKPQDDDIIRSKTIAKVTSTHVSETYADGSYCVPCVLMAC